MNIDHVCHRTDNTYFRRNTIETYTMMSYYTNGSKSLHGTSAAFILMSALNEQIRAKRFTLHPKCDFFPAKLFAIERALNHVRQKHYKFVRICTDSLS